MASDQYLRYPVSISSNLPSAFSVAVSSAASAWHITITERASSKAASFCASATKLSWRKARSAFSDDETVRFAKTKCVSRSRAALSTKTAILVDSTRHLFDISATHAVALVSARRADAATAAAFGTHVSATSESDAYAGVGGGPLVSSASFGVVASSGVVSPPSTPPPSSSRFRSRSTLSASRTRLNSKSETVNVAFRAASIAAALRAISFSTAPSTSPFAYSSCFKSSNAAASQASSRSSKPRRHW